MRKWIPLYLVLAAVLLITAGCSPPEKFDRDAFLMVSAYADEILPAVGETLFDLNCWARGPEDEERIEWLLEHAEKLQAIGRRHAFDEFPAPSEMESWKVNVKRGDDEWQVEGQELAPAVEQMKAAAEKLVALLHEIAAAGGDLTEAEQARVEAVKAEARRASDELHRLFYRT